MLRDQLDNGAARAGSGKRSVNPRDHQRFIAELSRLRPVGTVVLAALVVAPSLWEAATGNLSPVAVLERLALALLVCSLLVWATTGVVLHYARVQLRSRSTVETPADFER